MQIKQLSHQSIVDAITLANKLWTDCSENDLKELFNNLIDNPQALVLLAYIDDLIVGFCQCQLRNDYVEGSTSSPVGYLEGVYIEPNFRKQNLAKVLVDKCCDWAKQKGCSEFASDCELNNDTSLKFHKKIGFKEANRIICFIKKL